VHDAHREIVLKLLDARDARHLDERLRGQLLKYVAHQIGDPKTQILDQLALGVPLRVRHDADHAHELRRQHRM
jgi:hypothetical protein